MNNHSTLQPEAASLYLKDALEPLIERLAAMTDRLEHAAREGTPENKGRVSPAPAPPSHKLLLPQPSLVRQVIRDRRMRERYFDAQLFADPAWDMLLDLTASRAEQSRVSVTSLCIASGVPSTTALRWIGQMVEQGLFERVNDAADRRRAFIALSDTCADKMARYFADISTGAR